MRDVELKDMKMQDIVKSSVPSLSKSMKHTLQELL